PAIVVEELERGRVVEREVELPVEARRTDVARDGPVVLDVAAFGRPRARVPPHRRLAHQEVARAGGLEALAHADAEIEHGAVDDVLDRVDAEAVEVERLEPVERVLD